MKPATKPAPRVEWMDRDAVRLARWLARHQGPQDRGACCLALGCDEEELRAVLVAYDDCFSTRDGLVALTDRGRDRATVALLMGGK